MKTIAIIPSRYGSSRFSGKPLASIKGKPMIQHVYENVKKVTEDILAVEALQFIKSNRINNLPVVDDSMHLIGTITWQQIVRAGIVI